jgi:hypothetical protein
MRPIVISLNALRRGLLNQQRARDVDDLVRFFPGVAASPAKSSR